MKDLLAPHDRPIPASYRLAAVSASIFVFVSFATTYWVPWFVEQISWVIRAPTPTYQYALTLVPVLVSISFGCLMVVPVWLAFRWPGFALAIALLPSLVAWMDGNMTKTMPFGAFAVLGAVALTASWRRPVWSVIATGLAVLISWLWAMSGLDMSAPFNSYIQSHANDWGLASAYSVAFLVTLGGGLLLRRNALRDEERRALLARVGDVEEQSAVVEERARLARDLHDVVAHHVSLIAVRAETAPYTQQDLGDGAKAVLSDIAADARLALDELRGVLGILGRSGEDAARAPQPTWSDITALVERTRAAGLDVTLEGDTSAVVSPSVGYAAYRVVQEGLTNARKHAPGAAVAVRLEATDRLVHVSIRNAASAVPSAGGRGLVGMKERVSALGGRMTAGLVGAEYVVDVTLPVVTG